LLATVGAPIRKEDKLLLAWIAPRGIVAAATAGVFGPALVASGYSDAEQLLPIVFLIIMATVLAHGLSIGAVARRLGLAAPGANGLLIVGAWPWTLALAQALKKLAVEVLMVDGAYHRLKAARMEGIEVYYGEVLSEHAEHTLETQHLTYLLCATENDFYNALVCKAWGHQFGRHRTFQLALHQEASSEAKRLTLQQRGYIAFAPGADFEVLHKRLGDGWIVQSTRLSETFDMDQLEQRLGTPDSGWLFLGGITPEGGFRLFSEEQPFEPEAGWTLLYFAPAPKDEAAAKGEARTETEARPVEGGFRAVAP
ncbi:MAG: NAD-binding protein, partial [Xanthobacteraceae bacterium]